MGEFILALLDGIFRSIPSRRNRTINKKFKLLRKEPWYQERYSFLIQLNHSVRSFIEKEDIQASLNDPEENLRIRNELEKIVRTENL